MDETIRHQNPSFSDLKKYGWDSFFQAHYESQPSTVSPGRVFREEKNRYGVFTILGEVSAILPGKLRHRLESTGDRIVVGDWVLLRMPSHSPAVIEGYLPRKTLLSRTAGRGRKSRREGISEQPIAANIDVIFIVAGLDGEYNLRRIERYLALAVGSGAKPVVLLNKADLFPDPKAKIEEVRALDPNHLSVHALSAKRREEVLPLLAYLPEGVTGALIGSSGVGKSTLINALLGYEKQKVQELGAQKKGRHTTTHREMVLIPGGGLLIDNPGIREIQLWIDSDELEEAFRDIETWAQECRFRDCRHLSEPGCAVREAVLRGDLSPERLARYQKMKQECDHLKREIRKKRVKRIKGDWMVDTDDYEDSM